MKITNIDTGEGIGVWIVNTTLDPRERAVYTRAGLELRLNAKNQILAALECAVSGCAFVTTDGKDLSLAMQRTATWATLSDEQLARVAKKAVAQATRAYEKALRSYWS